MLFNFLPFLNTFLDILLSHTCVGRVVSWQLMRSWATKAFCALIAAVLSGPRSIQNTGPVNTCLMNEFHKWLHDVTNLDIKQYS